MPRHESADLSFAVPSDWADRTITAYSGPLQRGQALAPNLVITRDLPQPGETAQAYCDRQLVELARRLEGFELIRRSELSVDDLPAVELLFTWKSSGTTLKQRQVFVISPARQALSITVTVEKDYYDQFNQVASQVLATFRFR